MKSTTVCAFFVLLEIVAAGPMVAPTNTLPPVPAPSPAPTRSPSLQPEQSLRITSTMDIDCAMYDEHSFRADVAAGLNVDIARINVLSAACDTPATSAPGQVGRYTVEFEIGLPTAAGVVDPLSEPSQLEVEEDLMTQLACDMSVASVASCPLFGGTLTAYTDPGATRILPFCDFTICPTGQWCHVDHCEIDCASDADCSTFAAGSFCNTATSHCQRACTSSLECGANEWCHIDHCELDCSSDRHCPAGGVCVASHCKAACSVREDCMDGEWCHESHCEVNCEFQPCGSGQVCNPVNFHCEAPRPCEEQCGLVREGCHRNPNCAMALMEIDSYRLWGPEPVPPEPVPEGETIPEPPVGEPPVGEPPVGEPPVGEPPVGEPPTYTPVRNCDPQNWTMAEDVDACWNAVVSDSDMDGQWMFNQVVSCMDCCSPQPSQLCQDHNFGSGDELSVRCQNQCYPQLLDCVFEDSSNCDSVLEAISDGTDPLCTGDTTYDSTTCWNSVTSANEAGRLEFDELQECNECCESSVCDVCATECAVERSSCTGQCDAVYTAIQTRDTNYPACARELFDDEDAIMMCFASVSGGMDLVGFLDLMLLLQCEKCCHEPWCSTECGTTCHDEAIECYSNTNCMAAMDEIEIAGPGEPCHTQNEQFDWETCWSSLYPRETDGQDEFEDLLSCQACCGHPECDARRECQVECAAELGACTGNCFVAAIAINDMNYPNCAFDRLADTEDCWTSVLPDERQGRCEFDTLAECFGCCNAPFDFQNGRYYCPFDEWQADNHGVRCPPWTLAPTLSPTLSPTLAPTDAPTDAPTSGAPTSGTPSFVLASLVTIVVSVMLKQ